MDDDDSNHTVRSQHFRGKFSAGENQFVGTQLRDVHIHGSDAHRQASQAGLTRRELLTALAFEAMSARQCQIEEHIPSSLEWIWTSQEDGGPGFLEWLKGSGQLFWITGKPGSGKSTLTNYTARHDECTRTLSDASGRDWITVQFYFDFRARTQNRLENSITGLLRAILFQLVEQSSVAASALQNDRISQVITIEHHELSDTELYRLLKVAASAISNTHNVLAFVDGLDEFAGSTSDLVKAMHEVVKNGIHKLCLASRPEHLLHQPLSQLPHFEMQDHNWSTIDAYVVSAFEKVATMNDLEYPERIVQEIKSAAEGVILWARQVTASLVDLFAAGETEAEMQRELRAFPTKLDKMYERFFTAANAQRYRLEVAIFFLLVRTGTRKTSLRDIHCALMFMREQGLFPEWPEQPLREKSFMLRFRARTGAMVDITALDSWRRYVTPPTQYRRLQARLFHKSLDEYLTRSEWLSKVIKNAIPTLNLQIPWVELSARCILKNELTPQACSVVRAFVRNEQPDLTEDEKVRAEITRLRSALSQNQLIDSGRFLLSVACDILRNFMRTQEPLPNQVRQAVSTMLFVFLPYVKHCPPTLDGIRNRIRQIDSKNAKLLSLSPEARACYWAVRAGNYTLGLAWQPEDVSDECYTFSSLLLDAIVESIKMELKPSHRKAALTLVGKCKEAAADELASKLMDTMWYNDVALKVLDLVAPYLSRNRTASLIFSRSPFSQILEHDIEREGFNLWYSFVASGTRSAPWRGDIDRNIMKRLLKALLQSGLDINEPCCKYGPPLHTALVFWNIASQARIDVMYTLQVFYENGANINAKFDGMTVLQVAMLSLKAWNGECIDVEACNLSSRILAGKILDTVAKARLSEPDISGKITYLRKVIDFLNLKVQEQSQDTSTPQSQSDHTAVQD